MRAGRAESRRRRRHPPCVLTFLRRLSLLPEDGLNLLRVASILGSTFSMAELALVTGRTPAQLLPALAAAVDAGLFSESGDRLAFRHELVRDAIYHDLPVAVRKGLHRQAGEALGGAGAAVERVAVHVALGAEPGDAEAVDGSRPRRTPPRHGRRRPRSACSNGRSRSASPAIRPASTLAAEMVAPLLAAGRLGEAETVARGVLAVGPAPDVEVITRTGLAGVLSTEARYADAIDQLGHAAAPHPNTTVNHCPPPGRCCWSWPARSTAPGSQPIEPSRTENVSATTTRCARY